MKLKDIVGILSSYRTIIFSDFDTQEELRVYSACDIRLGSPYEDSDIRLAVQRDKLIISEFGDYDVMLISCNHSCLYVDLLKGVV